LITNLSILTIQLLNFDVALRAAHEYWEMGCQKAYEKSLFIFVSEFYYGIAEQRKLDLAARRISTLIVKTKGNDRS